jgi:hypothetical protein
MFLLCGLGHHEKQGERSYPSPAYVFAKANYLVTPRTAD